ncbi:MAG: glycosyltransferase family 39 protein [Verrucomicrobiota bacterium]|nr:glycosyltransferase family 39 protein [Verrucomicrobiota bacterium]
MPFITKPVHLDDPLFLWCAQNIQSNPGNFFGFSVNWYSTPMPMSQVTQNPPGLCYYFAIWSQLFGSSEVVLHFGILPFIFLAVTGFYRLATRYSARPLEATVLFVLTPAFFINGTNLMSDVPMLAVALWGCHFFLQGLEKNRGTSCAQGCLILSLALLFKFFAILLVPVLGLEAWRQKKWKLALWLLLPVATLLGYQLLTAQLYGKGMFGEASGYALKNNFLLNKMGLWNFVLSLSFAGGCFLPLLWFLWTRERLKMYLAAAFIGTFIVTIAIIFFPQKILFWMWPNNVLNINIALHFVVFLTTAAIVSRLFARSLTQYLKTPGFVFLSAWTAVALAYGFLNWSLASRFLLPLAVPLSIILSSFALPYPWTSRAFQFSAVTAIILNLVIAQADFAFACASKAIPERLANAFGGRRIWFQGHWGFQYYMQKRGHLPLDFKNLQLRKGDILVVPPNNTNLYDLPRNSLKLLTIMEENSLLNFAKSIDYPNAINFYSNSESPLSYLLGRREGESFLVFEVTQDIKTAR